MKYIGIGEKIDDLQRFNATILSMHYLKQTVMKETTNNADIGKI